MGLSDSDRAQSEMVGNVLLIGVVVIATSLVAVTVISNLTTGPGGVNDDPVQIGFQASATPGNITVSHNGGDSVDAGTVGVRLSNDTTKTEFRVDSTNLTGGDSRFDPGESFERAHGLNGTYIDILVYVQRPENSQVLLDTTVTAKAN